MHGKLSDKHMESVSFCGPNPSDDGTTVVGQNVVIVNIFVCVCVKHVLILFSGRHFDRL